MTEPTAMRDALGQLIDRYDLNIRAAGSPLSEAEAAELRALAAVYDLDTAGSPAEVWARLRPVLAAQTRGDDDGETGSLTVMVVEDDPETAEMLVDCLTDAGHRVVGPLSDADAAQASAGIHAVDVALLDINLAGPRSGVELARSLKKTWGAPVLFLSGDTRAAAANIDVADGLLMKPYKARDVLAALDAAVRRAGVAA